MKAIIIFLALAYVATFFACAETCGLKDQE